MNLKIEPAIASFLTSVTVLSFGKAEAEQASKIRATLKAQRGATLI